jgi:hypothetical protein
VIGRSRPLARRGALTRRTPIARRRKSKRRSARVYDAAYRAWVRRQPCCARTLIGHRCDGRVEGDHVGRRGLGQKCDDAAMVALCQLGHQHRDAFHGCFREWDQGQMRRWLADQVADHRQRYEAQLARTNARGM